MSTIMSTLIKFSNKTQDKLSRKTVVWSALYKRLKRKFSYTVDLLIWIWNNNVYVLHTWYWNSYSLLISCDDWCTSESLQIVNNSCILSFSYHMFSWSLYCSWLRQLTFPMMWIILWVCVWAKLEATLNHNNRQCNET